MATLTHVSLPSFGVPATAPEFPLSEYSARLDAVTERMGTEEFDYLLVYGDREHFANICYLTGFDPRFEEAILLLSRDGRRKLLVGNECLGYLPDDALGIEVELFQELSLLGQPRGTSRSLRSILTDFGIGEGKSVGCAGWKYYEGTGVEGGKYAIEIPAYIVDLLRHLTRDAGKVTNATQMFMNARDGLRITNSAAQIARFEFAAAHCSNSILRLLMFIKEGATERELEKHLDSMGLPLSCHSMLSFGEKAKRGLSSPSDNVARLGDTFTTALGLQGSLICRAGAVATGPHDLPPATHEFYPRFVANYFDVVSTWYSNIKVGANAGAVYSVVEARRDGALYDFAVNPGHYIHLDEWVNSPFYEGSDISLRSGMALQMDIIPVSNGPFCYANMEDSVVLADEQLRSDLATAYPEMWSRIQRRRAFMIDTIGIPLDESVLPLSNTAGWIAPYILDQSQALVNR